jgi:hypothetical protein
MSLAGQTNQQILQNPLLDRADNNRPILKVLSQASQHIRAA